MKLNTLFNTALLVSMACFAMACGNADRQISKDETQRRFELLTKDTIAKPGKYYYLLIPVGGCGKCVEKCIKFSKAHLNNDRITFILTSEQSRRVMTSEYTEAELSSSNILQDTAKQYIREGFTHGFVTLVTYNDGKMNKPQIVEPDKVDAQLEALHKEVN
ncbi:hypothetical protein [Chitinophaga agri]|uniref:Uncharacterized protein n=1 Tax=Chitinophaga agri TaxID=2703787 RepID=A0A6B9ZMQ9_9BACT|nr:hypothetical protein [Chitinophaga agri]QHS63532.1 hypothetical protein GWR21_29305 [Chitinophaga agri]